MPSSSDKVIHIVRRPRDRRPVPPPPDDAREGLDAAGSSGPAEAEAPPESPPDAPDLPAAGSDGDELLGDGPIWRTPATKFADVPAFPPSPFDNDAQPTAEAAPSGPSATRRYVDILAPEREAQRTTHLGDRAVRLRRPRLEGVRRLGTGVYEIVSEPDTASAFVRTLRRLRRALIGAPIRTEDEGHERLSKLKALAVFGSDNISSSAYATEEIMRVLILAGASALAWTMPLTLAIVALLAVVVVSYLQTIRAYEKGGGSYIVSSDNLGVVAGLVAGASIQVGYILTVAVSVSAGVAAITSAFPLLNDNRVWIAVMAVFVMAWGNLRGIRESGSLFAAPAYLYLACMFGLLGYGLFRYVTGDVPAYTPPPGDPRHPAHGVEGVVALSLFFILRAFTSGAVGLTGTEAIADGVGAFKPPESRNARLTLVTMACCFATIFAGISFLSGWLGIVPDPNEIETVNSQLTRTLVGTGPAYFLVQFATALLLVLAANTAFADFPRLAYFLARDKFLPSHFAFRGDRLAFNNGIIILAAVAAFLIVYFQGSVTALIPLYAVGVFVGFTLSQAALVRRWWRRRPSGWRWRLAINATGATVTTIVALVAAVTRFTQGAWVVLLLIPGLVVLLLSIRRHYQDVAAQLMADPDDADAWPGQSARAVQHYVLIPVSDVNRAALRAIAYARSLTGQTAATEKRPANGANGGNGQGFTSPIIQAVHVADDLEAAERFQENWRRFDPGVPLVVIEAPYRALLGPLLRYVEAVQRRHERGTAMVTVLLPEFMPAHWWEHLLHTHTALQLKGALLFRPYTASTSVPYHLHG